MARDKFYNYICFLEGDKMNNNVSHPAHYTNSPAKCSGCNKPIECIDIAKHMNFSLGNVLKYLWRKDEKGKPLEDLLKAREYLNYEIEKLEKENKL